MNPINSISSPISQLAGAAKVPAARAGVAPTVAQQAEEAAKGFESVLMGKLMEEMQKTIPKSGLFEDSTDDQVQDLFWMQLSQDLSQKGGIGLWKQLYSQFTAEGAAGSGTGVSPMAGLKAHGQDGRGTHGQDARVTLEMLK